MTNSPAKDTADYLETGAIGVVGGSADWAIFVSDEPASPANCITIYDTGGAPLSPDERLWQHQIQVRVRAIAYAAGYDKMSAIRDWLAATNKGVIVGGSHYVGYWVQSDIASIGKDQQNKHILVCNFRLSREPST